MQCKIKVYKNEISAVTRCMTVITWVCKAVFLAVLERILENINAACAVAASTSDTSNQVYVSSPAWWRWLVTGVVLDCSHKWGLHDNILFNIVLYWDVQCLTEVRDELSHLCIICYLFDICVINSKLICGSYLAIWPATWCV